ncbi:MAG: hypothetical protein VKL42_01675 [Snowella sp.]|nr:hypothetical protein [Snowella sp.]
MVLSKYEKYKRIFPEIRVSWSLYKLYAQKNWPEIWDYLIGAPQESTMQQSLGNLTHEWIEKNGWDAIQGLERLGLSSLKGLEQEVKLEKRPAIKNGQRYVIVGKPDLFNDDLVIDWKSGKMTGYEQQLQLYMWMLGEKCKDGFIVKVEPVLENGIIKEVRAGKIFQYARRKDSGTIWINRMETLASDIYRNLNQLDKYLRL